MFVDYPQTPEPNYSSKTNSTLTTEESAFGKFGFWKLTIYQNYK